MKLKQILLLISAAAAFTAVLAFQSCKNDSVVETTPPVTQNPNSPQLIGPTNESTINFFTPTLDWEDFPGASSYKIQVSLDANFAGTIVVDSSGITASRFTVPGGRLTTNSYYYWRVSAAISGGFSPWSSTWRFRIILSAPSAPILISPPNGAINQQYTPLLDWNNVDSAQFYRVQVSSTASFNSLIIDSNHVPVSQVMVGEYVLQVNTQYFWRVNASNSNGASTSPWSVPFSFTLMNGPEPGSISGTITFVDTNFIALPRFYKVGAFFEWPPLAPAGYDSLIITHIGNLYQAHYKIPRLDNGGYRVAVYPEFGSLSEFIVLGIYGCDTVHVPFSNCPLSPDAVQIINGWGVEGADFLSWADTSKAIFPN